MHAVNISFTVQVMYLDVRQPRKYMSQKDEFELGL